MPTLELPILDHLQGLLAFDLLLDVRIPILPDRRATHSIRLNVTQGAIGAKVNVISGLPHVLSAVMVFQATDTNEAQV